MSSPVFLLRPRGERGGRPDVMLLPMGRDRARLLLTRIDQLRETVARDPDMICVRRRERADVFVYDEGAMDSAESRELALAYRARNPMLLHLPRQPFHPRHELNDLDVSVEIRADAVSWHLLDTGEGRRFEAGPLTVAEIADALLLTIEPKGVAGVFGRLARANAEWALEAIEKGPRCVGLPEPRDIRRHLEPAHLLPLLEHSDRLVRERATACLSRLRPVA